MTGECSRCGACCESIAFSTTGMNNDSIDGFLAKGLKRDGEFLLIPYVCVHLRYTENLKSDFRDQEVAKYRTYCDIHDTKPKRCKEFVGKPARAGIRFYVPPGCTMKEKP